MSKKSVKNYIILVLMFAVTIGVTIYLCNWYKVYDEYQKQTPVIRGVLSEIKNEELEHFVLENPSTTIYMCTSSDAICRSYEKDFKKVIANYNLENDIVYLNLSDINQEEFVKKFNETYPYKVKLTTSYPAIVTFEDGKISYILQGNDEDSLSITKTRQYIELNNLGD